MTALPYLDDIPEAMRREQRWGLWRYETRKDRRTKVPFSVVTGHEASSTASGDWVSFTRAIRALETSRFDGIGFRLGEPWAGVDLDGCRDPETGQLALEAAHIIEALNTYTEVSPSGNGVKLFMLGHLPAGRRRTRAPWKPLGGDHAEIEMYDTGRYFTVTGDALWSPGEVSDCTEGLKTIHQEAFEAVAIPPQAVREPGHRVTAAPAVEGDDQKIMRVAFLSKTGPAIQRLWNGDTSDYGSQSEADCALVGHLAFWCGGDVLRVDRLFRGSALMRDKWDERHGACTYGELTLAKGMSDLKNTYRGPR